MSINWEAVTAIGQCAGALATFLAVYFSLNEKKPKVKIEADIYNTWGTNALTGEFEKICDYRLYVTVVNAGYVPVKIDKIACKTPKKYLIIIPEEGVLPKTLMPSEEVTVWANVDILSDIGLKCKDIFVAIDSLGRIYYQKVGVKRTIERFIWWKFGDRK